MDADVRQRAPLAALSRAVGGTGAGARFDRLDALRGIAIVWMAVFHFCFDLAHFRLTGADFYRDAFWLVQRTMIVSLFLFCAGMGQAVAMHQGQRWPRFGRRWAQVAGCAVLVSAGSALMFAQSWISFGVLHGMAVMLIGARLVAPWAVRPGGGRGMVLLACGLLAMLLPVFVQHPFFDTRLTNGLGLVTHKPRTEDWVPVFPWFGVMLWGLAAGAWLMNRRPGWLAGPVAQGLMPLALLGRWSLSFYMLHQPVLIGTLLLLLWMTGRA